MGIFREGVTGHEGYAVGFVTKDGFPKSAHQLRELSYPTDDGARDVEMVSAGCDCGWRSPRWPPAAATRWTPYIVLTAPDDDERVHELWYQHADSMVSLMRSGTIR